MRRHPAGLNVQLGNAAIIALENRHEILGEEILIPRRELADDAEIQSDEARIVRARDVHPDIAAVGIGMEEIVAKHLRIEHAHAFRSQCLAIDAGCIECSDVVRANAVNTFEREYGFARQRPVYFRHGQIVRIRPQAPHQAGIATFAQKIQLGMQGGFDFGNDLLRAYFFSIRMMPVGQSGQAAQQGNICFDLLANIRPQYFHHYLAAVVKGCRMHLRNRCRRQWRGVDTRKQFRHWLA